MTVADLDHRAGRARAQADGPFVVQGTVTGRSRVVAAGCPAEVLEIVSEWSLTDGNAVASWKLRDDHPGPVVIVARPAPGLVGESRRAAHVFEIRPGVGLGAVLQAQCGAELGLLDAEWLAPGTGMPCEGCLAQHCLPAISA